MFQLFCSLLGVALGYTSGRSPQRFAQSEQPDYDYKAARTLASHESFYDDSEENYHTSGDSSEYDNDGSPGQSQEKSNSYNNENDPPKWDGPLALPPGYEANGQPHPVQDLPAVVAERQKHLQLFSYGPHAGSVAAAHPYLKPVPGGYSSPWIPIIVPLHNNHHQQHQHQQPPQQPFHYNNINYQG